MNITLTSFVFVLFMGVICVCLLVIKAFLVNKPCFTKVYQFILLIGSYIFMAAVDVRYCFCIFLLTLLVYYCACRIEKGNRFWLKIGVVLSLLQLAFFKYLNFFVDSFGRLVSFDDLVVLNIIIPMGVSFYSFSGISYLMDVYRKKIPANKDFIHVALYIAFFPKLTSGPIVRAKLFFSQLDKDHCISWNNFVIGIQIFVFGLFKKMVLADHLCIFVDDVYNAPGAFTGTTVFLATMAYSLQIYFDFSGYSDLAIGAAKILGFDFEKNFHIPYVSKNVTEFWKRWHISLSSWLQEYLYYPLGGNRKGKLRTYVNLFLTMLIGGFWHGANWTFLIWGGLHGLSLIVHKVFLSVRAAKICKPSYGIFENLVSVLATFLWVNFCWIFFRADSLSNALSVIKGMFHGSAGISQPYTWIFFAMLILVIEMVVVSTKEKNKGNTIFSNYVLLDFSKMLQLAMFFIFVGITIIMAYVGDTAFIYGKF